MSVNKTTDGQGRVRWVARWRDPGSRNPRRRTFDRRIDADRFIATMTADRLRGTYIDPADGMVTVREYAEAWRAAQVHRPSSAAHVETILRRHVYPTLGKRPIGSVRPSEVQAWVRGLTLAPATVNVAHGILASIFRAAVKDRVIPSSPCEGTRLPTRVRARVEPLEVAAVTKLAEEVPKRLRGFVLLAASTGLRQGELLGLTVDRVDFLRRTLTVDRQLVTVKGAPYLGPPKTSASYRQVPLPQFAVDVLAAHLAEFPAQSFPLEWRHDGKTEKVVAALVFAEPDGPWTRSRFGHEWRPARVKAGLPDADAHDLRHFYASLLIRHNESVKVVQSRLGHATAAETLDTYSHLWPDSDDRTRAAVDEVLSDTTATPAVVSDDG